MMERKRKSRKGPALILALLLAMAALSGCGKKAVSEVDRIREAGTLRVAIVNTDSRFTSLEGEKAAGLEPDLCRYIADALGTDLEFTVTGKQEALAAVSAGEADIALGCLNGSGSLTADFLTSTSYGKGFFYAVTRRGDFALTVGALEESNVGAAKHLDDKTRTKLYEAEGITVESYGSAAEAAKALKAGTIRAYICYEAEAKELLEDEELQVQNLSNMDPEEFVIAAPKESQTLINGINTLIRQFLEEE